MNLIPIGNTTVSLETDRWVKHERVRYQVLILCTDHPFTDHDGICDYRPDQKEVTEVIDYLINEEGHTNLSGYSAKQITVLKDAIIKEIDGVNFDPCDEDGVF